MLHHHLRNASWANPFLSKSDNLKGGKKEPAVRRAALASVEMLENRQLLSAGQLDTSFGGGGSLQLPAQGTILASAVQSDGKLILVGSNKILDNPPGGNSSFLVERVNVNGTLDTSFGTNGVVTTAFSDNATAVAVAVGSNGKIVVGGGLHLAQYNADGSLDTSFNFSVPPTISPGTQFNIQSLVLGSDGSIYTAGRVVLQDASHLNDPNYQYNAFCVLHVSPTGDGQPFQGLSSEILQQIPADSGINETKLSPIAIGLQPDGKVLVGIDYKIDPAVYRFNTDGSHDLSFGNGGLAWIPLEYDAFDDQYISASVNKVIVQPDGKILVGGFANTQGNLRDDLMVGRFNANGTVDTAFGNTSYAPGGGLTHVGPQADYTDVSSSMVLQPDGKIVIGGGGNGSDAVVRLTAAGAVDSTFQFTSFTFSDSSFSGHASTLNLTPDGQLLLVDNVHGGNSPITDTTGIVRIQNDYVASSLTPAGTKSVTVNPGGINPTFGVNGNIVVNDPSSVWESGSEQRSVRATVVQADGKILIAGTMGDPVNQAMQDLFIARINTDGTIDTTFGTSGFITGQAALQFAGLTSIALYSDGRILVGGLAEDVVGSSNPNSQFLLARYSTSGVLDTTFGTNGYAKTNFAGNEQVDSIVIEPGNKIVAAGSFFNSPNVGFHVARYTSSGALDTTFNTTGTLTVSLGAPASGTPAYPTALAVGSDGTIVIGSHQGVHAAIYRYNPDGTPDTTFGTSGVVVSSAAGSGAAISALVVLPNNSLFASAVGVATNTSGINILRFSGTGVPDASWGTAGVAPITFVGAYSGTDPFFATYSNVTLLSLQNDGGVIAVGTRPVLDGITQTGYGLVPLVQKLTATGALDTTFQDSVDPHLDPEPYFRGQVVQAATEAADGSIIIAADVFADAASNPPTAFHDAFAPHWIGLSEYLVNATTYTLPVPASGVDFTPSTGGGGGGNPLPAGQFTATIPTALPARVIGGARGFIQVVLKNTGSTAFSGPISIAVYESTDATLDAGDAKLTTLSLSSIAIKAGKTRTVRVPFNYASTLATGSYRILANVTQTSSNTAGFAVASKRAVNVTMPVVDLALSFVPNKPAKFKAGKKGNIVVAVKNLGNVAAVGSFSLALFGSTDITLDQLDPVLATKTDVKFRLAAKATRRVSLSFNQVASLGSSYTLIAEGTSITTPQDTNDPPNALIHLAATVS